ncbi:MAG: hypothetical protein GY879_13675 [Planctomycetes bacterium]|nr:hypothetical protein [Planctomycetota bacterium]MCP4860156.1 hypothetical protein [Planctomycetota bacterium]
MILSALMLCLPMACAAPQDPAKAAEFSKKLMEAAEVSDTKAMSVALQKYSEDAILLFLSKADVRATSTDIEINDWVDAFVMAWDKTYHTDFARNYDRYLQRLDDKQRAFRFELLTKNYPDINRQHIAALNKEETAWGILRKNATGTAEAIDGVGDLFYSARAWNIVGNLYNPNYHEEGASAITALDAYGKAIDAREKLGLTTDRMFSDMNRVIDDLRAASGIADPDNPDADLTPKVPRNAIPAKEGSAPTEIPLSFSKEKKPGAIVHASDLSDYDHFNWRRGNLPKPGEQLTIGEFVPVINLIRVGATKYKMEAGAGETKEFRISEKPKVFSVDRMHTDGVVRPFTLELCTGTESDVYQGITMNLQPSDNGGPLFFRSVTTLAGETSYGALTIYDTSCDGKFGVEELALIGAEGMMVDTFLYRPDAMTLGKMKHSLPFSRFFPDAKGVWYEMTVPSYETPFSATLQVVEPKLGAIAVDYPGIKKLKLNSLIIESRSSATKGMILDLATFKGKQFMIPIGRYQVMQARFTGKGDHEMMVLMDAAKPYFVDVREAPAEGDAEVAIIELGAPFKLAATFAMEGRTAIVDGRSLHITGRHDERYVRFIGAPLFGVEVSAKGAKGTSLAMPSNDDAAADWERLFYPMDADLEMKNDNKPKITLSIKKHPWFGKLSNIIGG